MGTLQPNIRPDATSTSISTSANPAPSGSTATVSATVTDTTSSVVPFGSVAFTVNGSSVASPVGLDGHGSASIALRLPDGSYRVGAQYLAGTPADFVDSRSAVTQGFGVAAVTTPPPGNTTHLPAPVSAFELSRAFVQRGGRIVLYARSVDPGQFTFAARVRGHHSLLYRRGSVTTSGRNAVTLTIDPSRRAKNALHHYRRLRLRLTVGFQSAFGGSPNETTRLVTVTVRR
jgi:hypothetical protein